MKLSSLLTSAAITMYTTLATAGVATDVNVTITVDEGGSGRASGSMKTARFSSNPNEFIGCGVTNTLIPNPPNSEFFPLAFCQAGVEEGEFVICFTEEKDLVDTVKGISDYSVVRFEWDQNGECTKIGFSTQSFYLPNNVERRRKQKIVP